MNTEVAEVVPAKARKPRKAAPRKEIAVAQPVPEAPANSVLQVIERAARDPAVNIEKLEKLLQMKRDIELDAAQGEFNRAMSACQGEMRQVAVDASNPQTHSKYATYAALDKALRPIYTRHGFSISFDEADSPKPEHVRVLAYVAHAAGFTRVYHTDMPCDGKGARGGDVMSKTHAVGAAKSYGARYLLRWVFNIAVGEGDTDGNDPSAPCLTEKQQADLNAMITERGFTVASFVKWAKVDSLAQIPLKNYEQCVQAIKARGYAR